MKYYIQAYKELLLIAEYAGIQVIFNSRINFDMIRRMSCN